MVFCCGFGYGSHALSQTETTNQQQTNTKDAKDTEGEEKANEEDKLIEENAQPKKPQRLAGKLKRERIPGNEDNAIALLAEHFADDALVWLDTEHGRFLSLWQKDRSGFPKGALLIIHAEGEHPAWPNTTKPLHDSLPDHGWATLAISLPSPDHRAVPDRTRPVKVKRVNKSEEQDESTSNEEQAKTEAIAETDSQKTEKPPAKKQENNVTKEEKISAELISEKRMEAALKFLHDKGQFNLIILGSGVGAIRAQDFIDKITPKVDNPRLKAKLERPIRAMIMVNGRNHLPTSDKSYQQWFNDPDIPVLDIFTAYDPRNRIDAEKRKTLAKQKKVATYKQVKFSELNFEKTQGENRLSKRVRSFLDSNAVGIEVKNAKLRRYR